MKTGAFCEPVGAVGRVKYFARIKASEVVSVLV
jgi:hypothetical protein